MLQKKLILFPFFCHQIFWFFTFFIFRIIFGRTCYGTTVVQTAIVCYRWMASSTPWTTWMKTCPLSSTQPPKPPPHYAYLRRREGGSANWSVGMGFMSLVAAAGITEATFTMQMYLIFSRELQWPTPDWLQKCSNPTPHPPHGYSSTQLKINFPEQTASCYNFLITSFNNPHEDHPVTSS